MKQFYFLLVLLSFVSTNSQNLALDTTFGNNGVTIVANEIKIFIENLQMLAKQMLKVKRKQE